MHLDNRILENLLSIILQYPRKLAQKIPNIKH